MIKRFSAYDFDSTLFNSPEPEEGKKQWEVVTGNIWPYQGWWSKPESLDLNIFNVKPFPSVLKQLNFEKSKPNTHVIILTNRIEKLRPQIQAILNANHIQVDELIMKKDSRTKGDVILEYVDQFPDLEEINVYDDRETEIEGYMNIKGKIKNNILLNIYKVDNDSISLIEQENKLIKMINEEIENLKNDNKF